MNQRQLIKLIEDGENLNVEFKQRFSDHIKIAKEIIAFANTNGGVIIFGINDNGKTYGVDSEKEITELLKETIQNYCEPFIEYQISYIELGGKEVVVVDIFESSNKPHRVQDYKNSLVLNEAQVYIRVQDKSVPASKEMIKLLQTRTHESKLKNYSIGNNEKKVFEYLCDNDYITSKQLSKLANLSSRRASRTLINLVRANILAIHTKDNGEDYFSNISS
jgi:predicted HTH transcriptional regulator